MNSATKTGTRQSQARAQDLYPLQLATADQLRLLGGSGVVIPLNSKPYIGVPYCKTLLGPVA